MPAADLINGDRREGAMQIDSRTELGEPSVRRDALVWFVVGTLVGGFLIWTQATATGGVAGLLQVGEQSSLRGLIESELGPVPLAAAGGHDGQITYAIALDLAGDDVPDLLGEAAGHRYRRILLPALGSAFGLLDGSAALWSLLSFAAIGMGLATVGTFLVGRRLGLHRLLVLAVLANPGVWLAVRVLTPDALGLGLALLGLGLALHRMDTAAMAALALAALAKEQYLLVAGGLVVWMLLTGRHRRAWRYAIVPVVPLAVWSIVLSARLGGGFDPRNSLDLPFRGIVRSFPNWTASPLDGVLSVLTLALVVGLAAALIRSTGRLLPALGWPWIALALVSSSAIWEFGNNTIRAFAILVPLLAVTVMHGRGRAEVADGD